MLEISGKMGEGGGAVLRTSLSLSSLTGRPFKIKDIRANRSKPGLRPQHLTAVRAAAAICRAELTGAELGSSTLEFRPSESPLSGEYHFDVTEASASGHSAGAVTLILQTVLWPLAFAPKESMILIRGGTFVPFSPPFHYFSEVVTPAYGRFGVRLNSILRRWGWMSAGGGLVACQISSVGRLKAVEFKQPVVETVHGVAAVTNLPSHIPQRMAQRAGKLLQQSGVSIDIIPVRERGDGPGAGIVLWTTQAGSSSLGRPGLPAEKVAEAAVAEMLSFKENGAAVDRFLADQILIPMSLAEGRSSFSTDIISNHTMTAVELLRQWLGITIALDGSPGEPGQIEVDGTGFRVPQ